MEHVALIAIVVGLVIVAAGYVWLFVEAFKVDTALGFCCLLIPGVSIVFACIKPGRAIKPLVVLLLGVLLAVSPWAIASFGL